MDANAELRSLQAEYEQTLTEIIRAATNGPLTTKDAQFLCLACNLRVDIVLPMPINRRGHINPAFNAEWQVL